MLRLRRNVRRLFSTLSRRIGTLKLDAVLAANPDVLVSGDMGCLMHIEGLARKEGRVIRARHVAQVLRDAIAPESRLDEAP